MAKSLQINVNIEFDDLLNIVKKLPQKQLASLSTYLNNLNLEIPKQHQAILKTVLPIAKRIISY